MIRRPPTPPLFPYTTLFRSAGARASYVAVTRRTGEERLDSNAAARRASRSGRVSWALAHSNRPGRARWPARRHDRVLFRSEEHTSELQSHSDLVCRLLLEKK